MEPVSPSGRPGGGLAGFASLSPLLGDGRALALAFALALVLVVLVPLRPGRDAALDQVGGFQLDQYAVTSSPRARTPAK